MDTTTKKTLENLIAEMTDITKGYPSDMSQRPIMAKIQVILAEEQAKSAAKLERFTCWLVYFTIGLFFLGIVQIILMFCKP